MNPSGVAKSEAVCSCQSCGKASLSDGLDFECRACGGVLRLCDEAILDPRRADDPNSGVWAYHDTFPLTSARKRVSLGEGSTPLVSTELRGSRIHFKLEQLNPTGSFKDRGTSLLVSLLASSGVQEAVEDSSGNAAISLAAYCAKAGIRVKLFVPESTSPAKLRKLATQGTRLIRVCGPREKAAEAALEAARHGAKYASHIYNPIGLAGLATTAFEIWEQLRAAPDAVVLPLGAGTLLLGLHRGFTILRRSGLIEALPQLIGVQAEVCAPLWKAFTSNDWQVCPAGDGETIAEGIRISNPVRRGEVLAALRECHGRILVASEECIRQGVEELGKLGFYVEPTSAVVWQALIDLIGEGRLRSLVVILTGSGSRCRDEALDYD